MPAALLALHVFVATAMLDFLPSMSSRDFLATLDLFYVGVYFLFAAAIFLASYLRAPSGVLRQQLKWVTAGTFAGSSLSFCFMYCRAWLPRRPQPWMKLSVFSLVLIPLWFGYAIIRYRLMDVDIIFKRGLAYTFATAGVVAVYFAAIARDRRVVPCGLAFGAGGRGDRDCGGGVLCFSRCATGCRRAWTTSSIATGWITAAR